MRAGGLRAQKPAEPPAATAPRAALLDDDARDDLVAPIALYPAAYGEKGVLSFIVGENSVVFERDLAEATEAAAGSIAPFDHWAGSTAVE